MRWQITRNNLCLLVGLPEEQIKVLRETLDFVTGEIHIRAILKLLELQVVPKHPVYSPLDFPGSYCWMGCVQRFNSEIPFEDSSIASGLESAFPQSNWQVHLKNCYIIACLQISWDDLGNFSTYMHQYFFKIDTKVWLIWFQTCKPNKLQISSEINSNWVLPSHIAEIIFHLTDGRNY